MAVGRVLVTDYSTLIQHEQAISPRAVIELPYKNSKQVANVDDIGIDSLFGARTSDEQSKG